MWQLPFFFGDIALPKTLCDFSEAFTFVSHGLQKRWAHLPHELNKNHKALFLTFLEFSLSSCGGQWHFRATVMPFPWLIFTSGRRAGWARPSAAWRQAASPTWAAMLVRVVMILFRLNPFARTTHARRRSPGAAGGRNGRTTARRDASSRTSTATRRGWMR
jgi:hypothetical protein